MIYYALNYNNFLQQSFTVKLLAKIVYLFQEANIADIACASTSKYEGKFKTHVNDKETIFLFLSSIFLFWMVTFL